MDEAYKYLDSLLKDKDIVVAGISGGPDSMTLLYLLMKIRKNKDIKIVCSHVNHNVRKESKDEKVFLENWCNDHNIIFETMTITKYGDDNFENEARNIRYRYFDELVNKYNANYLMTAHHGDDLMETILMRLVRGSTLKGYSGFSQVVDKGSYKIVRPLIYTTKEEIEKFNKEKDIPYVIDKTNFDNIHTRNRYRKTVLPFLKKEDKNVHIKFLKFSKMLLKYDNFINKIVLDYYNNIYKDNVLDIDSYLKLDDVIKEKIIYLILESIYSDDLMLINDRHVTLIDNLISSNKKNTYIYLPNNVKIVKEYNKLNVVLEENQIDNYEIELTDYVILPNGKHLEIVDSCDTNGNDVCRLDSKDIVLPLRVRTRRNGDKMSLKNTNGHKKVKDILIDSKISAKDRELWPVVVDSSDTIVWLPGLKKSNLNKTKQEKCDIIIKYY